MYIDIGVIVISVKNALTDTVTLTFDLSIKPILFLGYSKVIPYTNFEHIGIIRFWVMQRINKQTDKQTNKQLSVVNIVNNFPT